MNDKFTDKNIGVRILQEFSELNSHGSLNII